MSRNPNPATRTGSPFVRVRIGTDDIFVSGDGILQDCEVTISEGAGLSNCSFKIHDRNLVYTRKYFDYVEKNDGLDPLFIPDRTSNRNRRRNSRGSLPDGASDQNKIQYMYDYYIAEGFSEYAAAAMVGSSIQESGLNQNAVNSIGASGLFQWLGERNVGMPGDFEGQVDFSIEDMKEDEPTQVAYGGPPTYDVLTDPNASESQVQDAIFRWLRWGDGETGSRWEYAEEVLQQMNGNSRKETQASVTNARDPEKVQKPTVVKSRTGQQITIELGFDGEPIVAYSFLHQSLDFDLFGGKALVFGGQAAAWVLAQRKRNTAYTNMNLKAIAKKICDGYGLTLEMSEDGPTYDYFPQRGQSDYEALLIECRRIGYRIQSIGNVLKIGAREAKDSEFILEYGVNMGMTFTVSHSAQSDSQGGARSSDPNDKATTGERKFYIDPDTGEALQVVKENEAGTGNKQTTVSTTGNHVTSIAPITRKDTDEKDTARKESEKRIKGIIANWSAPTLPEMLLLDPDTAIRTKNVTPQITSEVVNTLDQVESGLNTPLIEQGIEAATTGNERQGSETASPLDRVWVVESITHSYTVSDGFNSSGVLYTPIKNRFPTPTETSRSNAPTSNPEGFINPTTGTVTSEFGPRGGRNHNGIDIGNAVGTSIWASADGVVIDIQDGCQVGDASCGGGWGNYVLLEHADGIQTRYAHVGPGTIGVNLGDSVKQGEEIALMDTTGGSTGPHLHFEMLVNGSYVDPRTYIIF